MCTICVCVYISKDLNIKEYSSEYEDLLGKVCHREVTAIHGKRDFSLVPEIFAIIM